MTVKEISVLLTLLGVAFASGLDGRIVGGTTAVNDEFPYIVSIRAVSRHVCAGTILDKNHILTAAHCVHGELPSFLSVQYGRTELDPFENEIDIEKVIIHEDYNSWSPNNDIAILQLERNINLGANAQPVKLPTSYSIPAGDIPVVLTGWGRTTSIGTIEKSLKRIVFTKYSDEQCKRAEAKYNSKYHVCAGGDKEQCFGDCGAPMMIDGVQYGIMSWSDKPCATAKHPALLTSVANYMRWIKENMHD